MKELAQLAEVVAQMNTMLCRARARSAVMEHFAQFMLIELRGSPEAMTAARAALARTRGQVRKEATEAAAERLPQVDAEALDMLAALQRAVDG